MNVRGTRRENKSAVHFPLDPVSGKATLWVDITLLASRVLWKENGRGNTMKTLPLESRVVFWVITGLHPKERWCVIGQEKLMLAQISP